MAEIPDRHGLIIQSPALYPRPVRLRFHVEEMGQGGGLGNRGSGLARLDPVQPVPAQGHSPLLENLSHFSQGQPDPGPARVEEPSEMLEGFGGGVGTRRER